MIESSRREIITFLVSRTVFGWLVGTFSNLDVRRMRASGDEEGGRLVEGVHLRLDSFHDGDCKQSAKHHVTS